MSSAAFSSAADASCTSRSARRGSPGALGFRSLNEVAGAEGLRQERADGGDDALAGGVGVDDGDILAAELGQDLAAAAAGGGWAAVSADDSDGFDALGAGGDGCGHGVA